MKKSSRVLAGIVVLDTILFAGTAFLLWQAHSGTALAVPKADAVTTIAKIGGGAIGVVTAILAVAFVICKRNGD